MFWVIIGVSVLGGGAFRLLRGGAGIVLRGAGAAARKASESDSGSSEWADRVNSRLGPIKVEDTQPALQTSSPATETPRRGATVVMSGPKRSSGFGGSRSAEAAEAQPVAAAASTPVAAVVATVPAAPREPERQQSIAAPAARAAAPAAAQRAIRQPRVGGAAPRAQFGTKRA